MYLIWSNEQGAWWMPPKRGFTTDIDKAGRYTWSQARLILEQQTNEVLVDAPEHRFKRTETMTTDIGYI